MQLWLLKNVNRFGTKIEQWAMIKINTSLPQNGDGENAVRRNFSDFKKVVQNRTTFHMNLSTVPLY